MKFHTYPYPDSRLCGVIRQGNPA